MVRKSGAFDLNRCTVRQLVQLSGIPLDNARKLVRFRERQRRKARRMEEQQQARLQRRRTLREELREGAQPRRRRKPSPTAELCEGAQPSVMVGRSSQRWTQDIGAPEMGSSSAGSQQVTSINGGVEEPQLSQRNSDDAPRKPEKENECMQFTTSSLRTVDPVSHAIIVVEIKCPQGKVLRDQGTSMMSNNECPPNKDTLCVPIKQSPSVKEQIAQQLHQDLIVNESAPQQDEGFAPAPLHIETQAWDSLQDPATASSSRQLQQDAQEPLQDPPHQSVPNQETPGLGHPMQEPCLVDGSCCRICGRQRKNHSHSQSHSTQRGALERNHHLLEMLAENRRRHRRREGMQQNTSGSGNHCTVS